MRKFEIAKGFEDKDVHLPLRSTSRSAGYDFSSLDDLVILPGKTGLINTGVKALMEADDVLFIFPRSSLAVKKGLQLANSVAVIDADYYGNEKNDGQIMLTLYNFSAQEAKIEKGERVAQGIFVKYEVTDDDKAQGVRQGGYGSTGSK